MFTAKKPEDTSFHRRKSAFRPLGAAFAMATFAIAALPVNASAEEVLKIQSAYSFADTLARVKTALESKGMTIFAMIDHRAAAQSVKLEMPQTTVLIFGNPKGGTPLMLAAPDFALELPLRVLIREGEEGKTFVTMNPAASLEGKHGLSAGMTEKLAPAEKLIAKTVSAEPAGQ